MGAIDLGRAFEKGGDSAGSTEFRLTLRPPGRVTSPDSAREGVSGSPNRRVSERFASLNVFGTLFALFQEKRKVGEWPSSGRKERSASGPPPEETKGRRAR
jgi:hypothetical protein